MNCAKRTVVETSDFRVDVCTTSAVAWEISDRDVFDRELAEDQLSNASTKRVARALLRDAVLKRLRGIAVCLVRFVEQANGAHVVKEQQRSSVRTARRSENLVRADSVNRVAVIGNALKQRASDHRHAVGNGYTNSSTRSLWGGSGTADIVRLLKRRVVRVRVVDFQRTRELIGKLWRPHFLQCEHGETGMSDGA